MKSRVVIRSPTVEQGPDPEKLLAAIEKIAEESKQHGSRSALADSLTLLAARIEWVKAEESREQLRARAAELRQFLQDGTPA